MLSMLAARCEALGRPFLWASVYLSVKWEHPCCLVQELLDVKGLWKLQC